MAHGTPDWGVTAGAQTVFQLTDLAEHAVRLGSNDSFDRGGDVIYIEDFEAGLQDWDQFVEGAGGSTDVTRQQARSGLFAARLIGGSTAARRAYIWHRLAAQEFARLGVEWHWKPTSAIESMEMQFTVFDGVNQARYQIVWVDATNVLQYQTTAGALVTFATGLDLVDLNRLFFASKLVFDSAARQYIRFRLNNQTYSLAGIPGWVFADATAPHLEAMFRVVSRAGFNDQLLVDDVIVTQNEPG